MKEQEDKNKLINEFTRYNTINEVNESFGIQTNKNGLVTQDISNQSTINYYEGVRDNSTMSVGYSSTYNAPSVRQT